ncbi:MAG: hypothetical protein WD851_09190 [Pirellulales bacterium]
MAEVDQKEFDPYYKWLAIPPQEQPPHSYRLLGVTLFENDPDVIAAAADRQMAHIKSFTAGKYASHSQRLLNELSRARVCLLNADQKARYDVRLRDEIEAEALDESFETYFSQESEVAPSATAAATSIHHLFPPPLPAAPSLIVVGRRRRHHTRRPWIPLVLLLCAAVAGIGLFKSLRLPGDTSSGQSLKDKAAPPERRQLPPSRLPENELSAPAPIPLKPAPDPIPAPAQQKPPAPPPKTNRQQNVQLPIRPLENNANLVIDVDLSKPRQRVAVSHDSFQVLRFRIADKVTDVSQPLFRSRPARITLDAAANVTLQLEFEQNQNGAFIFVQPIVSAGDDEFPFTLPSLGRLKRQSAREYQRAAAAFAALTTELQNLDTFINAPVIKPLAERGRARTRKLQIEKQLSALQQQLARMETSLHGMDRLIDLAKLVDANCVVELAKVD